MEALLKKIEAPIIIFIILLTVIAASYALTAYNNYWQARLAKKQYDKA